MNSVRFKLLPILLATLATPALQGAALAAGPVIKTAAAQESGAIKTRAAYQISPKVRAYLEQHQVPADLKIRLDEIFGNPDIQEKLYDCLLGTTEGVEYKQWLESQDFIFLPCKINRCNIFKHKSAPGYIFKCHRLSTRTSHQSRIRDDYNQFLTNMARIKKAEQTQEAIKKLDAESALTYMGCFKLPNKWAYFVPQLPSTPLFFPQVIVVSQEIDGPHLRLDSQESIVLDLERIRRAVGFLDMHVGNFVFHNDTIFIIDTEYQLRETEFC